MIVLVNYTIKYRLIKDNSSICRFEKIVDIKKAPVTFIMFGEPTILNGTTVDMTIVFAVIREPALRTGACVPDGANRILSPAYLLRR